MQWSAVWRFAWRLSCHLQLSEKERRVLLVKVQPAVCVFCGSVADTLILDLKAKQVSFDTAVTPSCISIQGQMLLLLQLYVLL